jgi:hypothetical protein
MNKQICQKCGQEIPNEFGVTLAYCTNCGNSVQSLSTEKTAAFGEIPTLVSPKPKTNSKMTRYFWVGLGLAAVLLSALGIFGYWVWSVKNNLLTNYFDGNGVQTAAEAFKGKIGKPFKVFEIEITPEGITLQAQDPNNPRNLDLYKYAAGFVIGPTPVQVNTVQYGNLEQTTFPFDEINFAAVPQIAQEAVSKAGLEGGRVSKMTFNRAFAMKEGVQGRNLGDARWFIEIEGKRESVTATASPQGKLLGVDFSRTSQAANYTVITNKELQKAQNAIIETFGKDAQIFYINISNKSILIKIPHPEDPKKEKEYSFGINGLTANMEIGSASSANGLFPPMNFSEIRLADAVQFLEKAKEKSGLMNGKISSISISRNTFSNFPTAPRQAKQAPTEWKVSLKDGEKDASVTFDLKGDIIEK